MSVDVDEQANCVGLDRIMIEGAYFYPANIANLTKYRYYAEANIAFADRDVVFDSVPPGQVKYICGINIEDAYDSITTRCATIIGELIMKGLEIKYQTCGSLIDGASVCSEWSHTCRSWKAKFEIL